MNEVLDGGGQLQLVTADQLAAVVLQQLQRPVRLCGGGERSETEITPSPSLSDRACFCNSVRSLLKVAIHGAMLPPARPEVDC